MNLFKNIFGKKDLQQTMAVLKYPDRMLFETHHRIKNSYLIRSAEVTILNPDALDLEIGKAVIKHLILSKDNIRMPNDEVYKATAAAYKKNTGLKSIKAEMKDSLYVFVSRKNNEIVFTPYINGGTSGPNRGFRGLPEESLVIKDTNDFNLIGQTIKLAFQRCK